MGIFLILAVGTYIYQFPFKKYLVEQKLYSLLSEEEINRNEVHIEKRINDIKSVRGGYRIYFKVEGSSSTYRYDYAFKPDNWMKTYKEKNGGPYMMTEKIIFDEE